MTSHYDTLGIDPKAPPEEIKRAYRKKARKAHPDKGGTNETMAEVNKAYEVLVDPRRRLEYDETGNDQKPPVEQEAGNLLATFFAAALSKEARNLVVAARQMLEMHEQEANRTVIVASSKVAKFTARRARIKVKAGQNLVHGLIDSALAQLSAQIEQAARDLRINALAKEMLLAYESDEPVEFIMPRATSVFFSNGFYVPPDPGG